MSIRQLQPKPLPGPFTGPVNVNELNSILRDVDTGLSELRLALAAVSAGFSGAVGWWEKTATTVGSGAYDWDTEKAITATGYYGRQSSNSEILLIQPGTYLVLANLRARSDGVTGAINVGILQNGSSLATNITTLATAVTGTLTVWALVQAVQASTVNVGATLTVGDRRFLGSQFGVVKVA